MKQIKVKYIYIFILLLNIVLYRGYFSAKKLYRH